MSVEKCHAGVLCSMREIKYLKPNSKIIYYKITEYITKNNKEKKREKGYRSCQKKIHLKKYCSDHLRQESNGKNSVINLVDLVNKKIAICVNPPVIKNIYVHKSQLPQIRQPIQVKMSEESKRKTLELLNSTKLTNDNIDELSESSEITDEEALEEEKEDECNEKIFSFLNGSEYSENFYKDVREKMNNAEKVIEKCIRIYPSTFFPKSKKEIYILDKKSTVVYESKIEPFEENSNIDAIAKGVLIKVSYEMAPIIYQGKLYDIVDNFKYKDFFLQKSCITGDLYYPNDTKSWVRIGNTQNNYINWVKFDFLNVI